MEGFIGSLSKVDSEVYQPNSVGKIHTEMTTAEM